ncbi:HAMP domain-containing protein [Schumannella luteola]|uniref:histidine kinase n=1 Tax=Schumannella luteola TaxID=472059 RepID=A0A852YG12_9MICO|nr:ATP-binding protein [Schumannella luteola]NYG97988.1 signal transduction histidine kinase [Schumannella luteola]TPX01723.1 HAMP domain-containing protein [Schumannella luteola]
MPNLGERIRRATWSVRSRIVVSILVTAAFGLGVAGIVSYELQRTATLQAVDDRLEGQLAEARQIVDAEDSFPSVGDALEKLMTVSVPPDAGGTLGILNGTAKYSPGTGDAVQLEKVPGFTTSVVRTAATGEPRLNTFRDDDGTVFRYLAAPITIGSSSDTGIYVVAIDTNAQLASLDATFRVYAGIAALSWVVIGVIGWLIAGRLLKPLRRLNSTAARISTDALDERIPVAGRDDVSAMTVTVNSMLDRIQTGVDQQRQLLEDVRHELKTPLSIVRGELELLDAADEREVTEARRIGIEEIDRMVLLLNDLADLTEVRTAVPDFGVVDLTLLTDDVLARAAVLSDRPWSVTQRATGEARLDRGRVIQAWLQLAENADKYSPAGAPVELSSVGEGDEVRFSVRDHGEPIAEELRGRIFDRFVRGADAERADGTGLGLAIVSAIAAGHGGRAELSVDEGGNTFSLVLPRLSAAALRIDEERRLARESAGSATDADASAEHRSGHDAPVASPRGGDGVETAERHDEAAGLDDVPGLGALQEERERASTSPRGRGA